MMPYNLEKEIEELRAAALEDARCTGENNVSLNPFSTVGGRLLWQKGWEDVRPANLVDSSIDWRFWERGRQAKIIAQEQGNKIELERQRG
jgi:hypothetical protein